MRYRLYELGLINQRITKETDPWGCLAHKGLDRWSLGIYPLH